MVRALAALLLMTGAAGAWEPNRPDIPNNVEFRSTTRITAIAHDAIGGDSNPAWVWIRTEDDATAICERQQNAPRYLGRGDAEAARRYIWVNTDVRGGDRVYTSLLRAHATGAPLTLVVQNCTLKAVEG